MGDGAVAARPRLAAALSWLHLSCAPGEVRVAALEADGLLDYAIWRPGRPDGVEDAHRGRVEARVPGMSGVFVALAEGDGFLPDTAGGAGLTVGDVVAVRVIRAAQGGKGPRLAALDEAPGAGPPALLRRGPSPVERLAALHPGPIRVDDPAVAAALRPGLGARVELAPPWDEALEAAVAALGEPAVLLPGGLRASFEPTAPLVAIDLDTAAATAGREAKTAKLEAANRAALPGLARQIRLRNLSGALLVDVAGLSTRRREKLLEPLRAALQPDPLQPRVLGLTAGGLIELARPRRHPPLHELLAGPHAAGLAALRRLAAEAVAPAQAVLRAAPDVTRALQEDRGALADLARRLGRPLVLRSDPGLPGCAWVIEEMRHG